MTTNQGFHTRSELRQAVRLYPRSDWADTERVRALRRGWLAAIRRLGTRWLLHPARRIHSARDAAVLAAAIVSALPWEHAHAETMIVYELSIGELGLAAWLLIGLGVALGLTIAGTAAANAAADDATEVEIARRTYLRLLRPRRRTA